MSPKGSERTVKTELPRLVANTWQIGELRPSSSENAPSFRSQRGSIETIQTLRKKHVSAIRQRDLLAMKGGGSKGRSAEHVNTLDPRVSVNPLSSPLVQDLHPKLWQPPSTPLLSERPKLWQPRPPPSCFRQQAEPKPSESQTNDGQPSQQQTTVAPVPVKQETEQIMEITKTLMQLQQQNAMMLQTLVAVTNMGSSYHDIKLLSEPRNRVSFIESGKSFGRVKSTLIEL